MAVRKNIKKSSKKRTVSLETLKRLEAEIERLKETSRSKDEFIQITNHELRTPLDVIRGNLDMVLKGESGPISKQTKEYLEDVLLGADRLTKLVNTMLDISKAESGRMTFSLEKIDIEAFLKNIDTEFLPIAKEKGIGLILKIHPPIPKVISDKTKLYQIMDNLLGNSIKFTPKGGLITIYGDRVGDRVRIVVGDTGIGIRSEDMPKLFRRFPGIDTSMIGTPKGNGLGLALIAQLIEKLGGRIWAESEGLGKGSRFIFELPTMNNPEASKLKLYEAGEIK